MSVRTCVEVCRLSTVEPGDMYEHLAGAKDGHPSKFRASSQILHCGRIDGRITPKYSHAQPCKLHT